MHNGNEELKILYDRPALHSNAQLVAFIPYPTLTRPINPLSHPGGAKEFSQYDDEYDSRGDPRSRIPLENGASATEVCAESVEFHLIN